MTSWIPGKREDERDSQEESDFIIWLIINFTDNFIVNEIKFTLLCTHGYSKVICPTMVLCPVSNCMYIVGQLIFGTHNRSTANNSSSKSCGILTFLLGCHWARVNQHPSVHQRGWMVH